MCNKIMLLPVDRKIIAKTREHRGILRQGRAYIIKAGWDYFSQIPENRKTENKERWYDLQQNKQDSIEPLESSDLYWEDPSPRVSNATSGTFRQGKGRWSDLSKPGTTFGDMQQSERDRLNISLVCRTLRFWRRGSVDLNQGSETNQGSKPGTRETKCNNKTIW